MITLKYIHSCDRCGCTIDTEIIRLTLLSATPVPHNKYKLNGWDLCKKCRMVVNRAIDRAFAR